MPIFNGHLTNCQLTSLIKETTSLNVLTAILIVVCGCYECKHRHPSLCAGEVGSVGSMGFYLCLCKQFT